MKLKLFKYAMIACSFILAGDMVYAQSRNRSKMIEVRVLDEDNAPIEGVTVSSDKILLYTDYSGRCHVRSKNAGLVELSAPGYYTKVVDLDKLKNNTIIMLEDDNSLLEKELLDNGFYKKSKEATISSVSRLNVAERIRENTTGNLSDYINGMACGMFLGNNVRGFGAPLYVVDGVPGRDLSNITAKEVEDVTFLKDANAAALWGAKGVNGVVYIKTKRGCIQKNEVTVSANYGMFIPKSFPEYLDAAEYMTLYNEARLNDGLDELYDSYTITQTREGTNPYKYPDVDFYSKEYLRPFSSRAEADIEFRGGNKGLQYYVMMNYHHIGSLERINPSNDKGANNFDIRANLDMSISKWIKSSVDVNLYVGQNRNGFNSILNAANNFRPNLYCPLIPIEYISDVLLESDMMKSVKQYNKYILGGSSVYKDIKPFASIFGQGYTKAVDRLTQVSNTIDFDLGMITEGLYLKTRISFDYYDKYSVNLQNKFNFYEPVWSGDEVIDLIPLGEPDAKAVEETVGMRDFMLKYGGFVELGYKRVFNGKHSLNAMLLGFTYADKVRDVKQTFVDTHMAFDFSYDYAGRYFIDFSGAVMSSPKLAPGHRAAFSPAISLGWIISNEDFLKNSKSVDFLRLRTSYANLASDQGINKYFLYQDVVNINNGVYSWADGAMFMKKTQFKNGANPYLKPLRNRQFTLGLDASFFRSLDLSASYFLVDKMDFVKRDTFNYPNFYDNFVPFYNDGIDRYQGMELSVNYGKRFGDFSIDAGLNFVYSKGVVKERDELNLEYDYLSVIGTEIGSIRGLEDAGFYQTKDFNLDGTFSDPSMPIPSYGAVQAGDIRYVDKNNDGIIDNLDEHIIGSSYQPYSLGLNMTLKYRNFSLFIQGRGLFGGQAIKNHSTYYWADGNDKYSTEVLGRWKPDNAETATFPRLTSGKSVNNYRNSTFWLYNKSFFDLARVQFTYSLPAKACNRIGFSFIDLNITGTNLFKIAPERKILELGIGNPQYRGVMFGVRFGL